MFVLAILCQGCGSGGSSAVTGAGSGTPTGGGDSVSGRATVAVEARYTTQSNWGAGFVGQVALTNSGSSRVTDWQVEFDLPAAITNIWNARIVSRTGDHYVVSAESYNNKIEPGQTVTFGFQGAPAGTATNLRVTGELSLIHI